jgi:hypothetical protein
MPNRVDSPDTEQWENQPTYDGIGTEPPRKEVKVETKETERPIDDRSKQWTNRRRMAWLSLLAMLVITGFLVFYVDVTRIEALSGIIDMFYIAMTSIVGAFIGFQTWWNVRNDKK